MKIVLNRQEVIALRELTKTMDSIQGSPTIKEYLEDFKISKKAYIMSMVTGEMTIETTPELIVELLGVINNFYKEITPFMTAIIGLCKAMVPAYTRYDIRFTEFFNKYREEVEEVI